MYARQHDPAGIVTTSAKVTVGYNTNGSCVTSGSQTHTITRFTPSGWDKTSANWHHGLSCSNTYSSQYAEFSNAVFPGCVRQLNVYYDRTSIFGQLPPVHRGPARTSAAVLARRGAAAPLQTPLAGQAAGALQLELDALAPRQALSCSGVATHVSSSCTISQYGCENTTWRPPGEAAMTTESLADALEREHREIDRGIEAFLAAQAHGRSDIEPLTRAMTALRRHIFLEEEFLFPPLRDAGMVAPIFVMLREHGEIWDTMDAIESRLATHADETSVPESCQELLARLQQHNAKEEPIIYPQADTTLSAEARERFRAFLAPGQFPEGWTCARATA